MENPQETQSMFFIHLSLVVRESIKAEVAVADELLWGCTGAQGLFIIFLRLRAATW